MFKGGLSAPTAFAGLGYCLAGHWGLLDEVCSSGGCGIYSGTQVLGISLFGWGALFFGLGLAAVLVRRLAPVRGRLACVGALASALLLCLQAAFWPCLTCLVGAVFCGAFLVEEGRALDLFQRRRFRALVYAWLFLFGVNVLGAGKAALAANPWTLAGPGRAGVLVYFSPGCPACADLIRNLAVEDCLDRVGFVPISKGKEDEARLAGCLAALRAGEEPRKALLALVEGRGRGGRLPFLDRVRLMCNKASLASRGGISVPIIVGDAAAGRFFPSFSSEGVAPAPDWRYEGGIGACGADSCGGL